MSRSNNTELINPAKKFFQWDGTNGGFNYFDKTKGEKGERIHVALPFRFLVLDALSTIKGFDDKAQSGYWSNEIRDLSIETLVIRNKNGICAKGLYEHIIVDANTKGSKYCQSVYIGYFQGEEMILANIQIMGAALGSWIDFRKKNKIFDGAISITECIEGKKGITVYKIPVYKKIEVSKDSDSKAQQLDIELQDYLSKYFKINKQEIKEANTTEQIVKTNFENETIVKEDILSAPNDDLPF